MIFKKRVETPKQVQTEPGTSRTEVPSVNTASGNTDSQNATNKVHPVETASQDTLTTSGTEVPSVNTASKRVCYYSLLLYIQIDHFILCNDKKLSAVDNHN